MINEKIFGSRTLESDNNEVNSLDFIITKSLQKLNTIIPAIVIEDQSNDFFLSVKPAINGVDGNGNPVNQPNLYNVPINYIYGGNAGIITQYKKGDTVALGFANRDISGFKKTFKQSNQELLKVCDIQDAIIICGLNKKQLITFIKIVNEGIFIETDKDINLKCVNFNVDATNTTIKNNVNLGGEGGSLVLTMDAQILDGDGKPCTISSAGSTKVKAS